MNGNWGSGNGEWPSGSHALRSQFAIRYSLFAILFFFLSACGGPPTGATPTALPAGERVAQPSPVFGGASSTPIPSATGEETGQPVSSAQITKLQAQWPTPLPESPAADTPTPIRFLPHWEAILLVHARRTQVLPEAFRTRIFSSANPFSVGCVLIRGQVGATWSLREGSVVVEPLVELSAAERDELEAERTALDAVHR